MRILELILRPAIGGAEILAAGLADEFRRAGHRVDVVALDAAADERDRRAIEARMGAPIRVASDRVAVRPRQLRRFLGMARTIRALEPDVIHSHSFIPNVYARMAASLVAPRTPVVVTLHSASDDFASRKSWLAERALAARARAIVAVSEGGAEGYLRHFPGMAGRVHVIRNGISTGVMAAPNAAGPARFVAVGRITPQKDVATLLRGFAGYAAANPLARLRIAGPDSDPVYAQEMRRLRDDLGMAERIEFAGPVGDVAGALAAADVFVHAATAEAHPVAILEAAAAGLPIVAPDIPEIRDICGADATYFRGGDPAGLCSALTALEAAWVDRMGRARNLALRVEREHSLGACAGRYLAVFGEGTGRAWTE